MTPVATATRRGRIYLGVDMNTITYEVHNHHITSSQCFIGSIGSTNLHTQCTPVSSTVHGKVDDDGNTYLRIEETFRCICDCHSEGVHVYQVNI